MRGITVGIGARSQMHAALTESLHQIVDDNVTAVIVFGSVGRGEAGSGSDVDLAVIADGGWDDRARIQDAVRTRLVSDCDMLAFTSTEFSRLVAEGEPVVADILRDCVTLIGTIALGNGSPEQF